MKGLELARQYWEEIALPAITVEFPELLEHAAFGLAGEGSECFGFDDDISRDHDWGPGFCIWMTDEDYEQYGREAEILYQKLPLVFQGFQRLHQIQQTVERTGVQTIRQFYGRLLGIDHAPQTELEWFFLPEQGLAAATNGTVFLDHPNAFSHFRTALLSHYPTDVRLKKLAAHCALAAQAGQYNYARCQKRNDPVSSILAVTQFIEHVQSIVFLLNKAYRPYYKWSQKAMNHLPILGSALQADLNAIAKSPMNQIDRIETVSQKIITELRLQGLSNHPSDFLLHHGAYIQAQIQSPALRQLHLMAE